MNDQELIARLRSDHPDYLTSDAADRIEALGKEVARLKAGWQDAASAAAYEAAAQTCDNVTNNNDFTRDIRRTSSYCAERIRALATPDQTAAMDRVRAEAKAEGMREALSCVSVGYETWASKPYNAKWVRRIDGTPIQNDLLVNIQQAILAAIPKQEQRHD